MENQLCYTNRGDSCVNLHFAQQNKSGIFNILKQMAIESQVLENMCNCVCESMTRIKFTVGWKLACT